MTSSSYYFLNRTLSSLSSDGFGAEPFLVSSPSDYADGEKDEVVDMMPKGASADDFGPRTVMSAIAESEEPMRSSVDDDDSSYSGTHSPVGSLLLQRKVPIKVDPKTYFANERTLLLWLHSALWLFGGATTIMKYADADPYAQAYGVALLPIALAFTSYALFQHARRVKMIRVKHPGPYEDLLGPVTLGIVLMTAIAAQFALKFYTVWHY